MPRGFTTTEREAIRARLHAAARDSIARIGVRRTSIDELVRVAGISKGAFYGFFPSKEALVLDVLLGVETEVRAELDETLARPWSTPEELIARFLRFVFDILDRHPVLRALSDPTEAASLFRAMPPEAMAAHASDDDRYFADILARWRREGIVREIEPELFSSLPRAAMALSRQRDLIGEERFVGIVDLICESIAANLAAGPHR